MRLELSLPRLLVSSNSRCSAKTTISVSHVAMAYAPSV